MARSVEDDWPENQCVSPGASRSNELLHRARVEAQFQVFAGLRAMWADLLAQPVPAHLLRLIREFKSKQKGSQDDS